MQTAASVVDSRVSCFAVVGCYECRVCTQALRLSAVRYVM